MLKVCVRFAPSPTGFLHIGGLRTALFNWLFAKKNKGKFILRIEDTDKERFKEGAVENIIEALKWYGLDFDGKPVYQSKRLDIYKKYIEQLIEQGNAYYCFCSAERLAEVRKIQEVNKQATKYDGLCRSLSADEVKKKLDAGEPHVVRLKVPAEGSTEFDDIIYGHISVENKNIDDQVLLKSDGYPTYHLANIVDDHEQDVTHVIRAEEWLPSTPKHILLYKAFGWQPPKFAHLPMVLGSDRSKLSKRHGAVPALEYKDKGYLPEAIINFITLLGWNPKTEQEIFSLKELIKEFDLSKVNKASAIFNIEKLDWLNGQYIKKIDIKKLTEMRKPYIEQEGYSVDDEALLTSTMELERDRLKTLNDSSEVAGYILQSPQNYDASILVPQKGSKGETINVLKELRTFLGSLLDEKSFEKSESLKEDVVDWIKKQQLTNQQVLWPLRVAVTGLEKSADVFDVMVKVGQIRTLHNIDYALERLQKS
jgi:glutamyl-tRNA synthetase